MSAAQDYDDWVHKTFGVHPAASAAANAVSAGAPGGIEGMIAMARALSAGKVSANDGDALAQEVAVLDSMHPSKDDPNKYSALKDGKEVVIAKTEGDALRAKVSQQMLQTLATIDQWKHGITKAYEQAQPEGYMEFVAARTMSMTGVKDPGDQIEALMTEAYKARNEAHSALAKGQFAQAARAMAADEAAGAQAEQLVEAWSSKTQSHMAVAITVLKHTRDISKQIAKTIAEKEFGPAGAAAIDTAFAAADMAGEAAAGHDIDWTAHVIDLGMDLLMDKYGNQAEDAVKKRLEKYVASKLAGRMAKEKAAQLAEKLAKKVASKAVSKGSSFAKTELTKVAEKAKGQKMKWATLMDATIAAMGAPDAKAESELESLANAEIDQLAR